jgi:dTDP-4-dehydrorhamnose reductase
MKTLLVTGASGFLGWNICQEVKSDWSIFGTYFSHPVSIPDVTLIRADLTILNTIKRVFKEVKPDAVIHTAAISNPNFCQENRKTSYKINTEAAINIAGLCSDSEIPCLFTSSDLVFDGNNPPYSEEDEPSPVNVYGEQKVMAEIGMKNRYTSVVICRMPLMFGSSGPSATSFIQPLLNQMKLGVEVNLFVDEYRTPLSGKNAAEGLMIALKELPDIIHIGGLERISRYEFGKLLMRIFNIPNAKLNPCSQRDLKMAAMRPLDVSFDCAKAKKLGFQPDTIKVSLQKLK